MPSSWRHPHPATGVVSTNRWAGARREEPPAAARIGCPTAQRSRSQEHRDESRCGRPRVRSTKIHGLTGYFLDTTPEYSDVEMVLTASPYLSTKNGRDRTPGRLRAEWALCIFVHGKARKPARTGTGGRERLVGSGPARFLPRRLGASVVLRGPPPHVRRNPVQGLLSPLLPDPLHCPPPSTSPAFMGEYGSP